MLGCWVGEEGWEDRLTPEEIPGWKPLSEGGPLGLIWESSGVSMDGATLFEVAESYSAEVEASELPGFLKRKDEEFCSPAVHLDLSLPPGTNLYGMGQRSAPMERTGLVCSNWTTDCPLGHNRSTDPLYQAHPLLWGVSNGKWWALLFCHTSYSTFDLGQSERGRVKIRLLGSSTYFQVYAAGTPAQLLRSLQQSLRLPNAPPLWSLGFHQSRWGYKNVAEVEELVREFRERKLPLDVVHLDIDHMHDYRSFTFDPERFPNPETLFEGWREQGVRAVNIIDPGLKFDASGNYQPLTEGLSGGHFLCSGSGAPAVGYCWPDEALFPDYGRADTRKWWAERCEFYLNKGISGLWIDMNEPAIFDKPFWSGGCEQEPLPLNTPCGEDHKRLDMLRMRNVYGSGMAEATRGAWNRRGERPWILTRSGFTGVGAEAWSWMGDNTSWWEHLAMSLPQLASMSLVGSSLVGVDIGGFFGNCHDELYGAWIEASVLYPLMRAHSALGTDEQHPWTYGPEVEETARKALGLRYRLLPYLYTAIMEHCRGDLPPMRPMFFDYPEELEYRCLEDQVMWGPDMVAAPFVVRGRSERMVRLPEGEWYDFHTGEQVAGGAGFVVQRRPGLVPLFVHAGAVIPTLLGEPQCTDQALKCDFEFLHFPAQGKMESSVYWDSGNGWEFQEGDFMELRFVTEGGELRVLDDSLPERFRSLTARVTRPGEVGELRTLSSLVQ